MSSPLCANLLKSYRFLDSILSVGEGDTNGIFSVHDNDEEDGLELDCLE